MKNDKILGPLRHSGYVTTMLIANQLAGLWFTYDHMLDLADQVSCVFAEKILVSRARPHPLAREKGSGQLRITSS